MLVKWIHILSSTILFGTGIGIAFFMLMAHRTRDPKVVAAVAGIVVTADFIFTATAGVVQPVTGFILMSMMELSFAPWIVTALSLFVFVGACWVPVVFIQIRMKRLAEAAVAAGAGLPPEYDRLYRIWVTLGAPAFLAMVVIFYLMLAQPALWGHAG
ncbi:MAG: DUF2269 domain-containing protein [Pseudomonadota bacterium]|nr:DUF2269 domain-containing protein [Pseudomonadota bacterium]